MGVCVAPLLVELELGGGGKSPNDDHAGASSKTLLAVCATLFGDEALIEDRCNARFTCGELCFRQSEDGEGGTPVDGAGGVVRAGGVVLVAVDHGVRGSATRDDGVETPDCGGFRILAAQEPGGVDDAGTGLVFGVVTVVCGVVVPRLVGWAT